MDDNNPISPVQKPRGYGGVAILWQEELDYLVDTNFTEGNERIVAIKIQVAPVPILLLSVYLPSNRSKSSDSEYMECIDILHEITRKYHSSHQILLCGDWNCDLTKNNNVKRKTFLNSL